MRLFQRPEAVFALSLMLFLVTGESGLAADTAEEVSSSAPNPATMTQDERRAAYEMMSDEEKADFREMMRNYYQSLSPEERAAAKQKARERYDSMTPDEQKAAKENLRQAMQTMTPEERAAAKQKARERYQNMSAEERQELKDKRNAKRKGSQNASGNDNQ